MKTLKHYQLKALNELKIRKKAFLNLDAGLGKTIISLSLAKQLNLPTLVVCEKNKIQDWIDEGKEINYDKFAIINYAQVHRFSQVKKSIKVLLVDECQNMGGYNTKKGRAIIDIAQLAKYVIFISATPLKSNPINLYWPLKICGGYKGEKLDFRLKYCGAYYMPGKNFLVDSRGITNKDELLKLKNSCAVRLDKKVRKVKIKKKTIEADIGIKEYKLNKKKRKLLNTPEFERTSEVRRQLGELKLKLFKQYIDNGLLEPKAVFFTYHRDITFGLAKHLKCPYLIGGQSKKERETNLKSFIDKDKGYIVISISSGSEGLNIFNCNTCYFIELSYSPNTYKQACYRFARDLNDTLINAYFFKIKNEHADLLNQLNKEFTSFNA